MNKLGMAVGCLLMIGAFAAPVAFAHYDTGAHDVPYTSVGQDTYGYDDAGAGAPKGNAGGNADRVSGWYYSSTNTWTELDSAFVVFDGEGDPEDCPADDPETPINENGVCQLQTSPITPSFLFAQWGGLYDVEVGGLGDCDTTNALNEEVVDGSTNGGGSVPDGVHNDGGNSAVGHTFGHYDCPSFETDGCDRYDQAFAEDAVGGEDVWIGASCSWGTAVTSGTSPGLVDVVLEFIGDVINCPLGGFPDSCLDAVNYLDDCGLGNLLPTLLPGNNEPNCGGDTSTTVVCGAGGVSDIDFGRGQGTNGGSSSDPSDAAIYPNAGTDDDDVNCDESATAAAFPLTSVIVTQNSAGALGIGQLAPATYGWVA